MEDKKYYLVIDRNNRKSLDVVEQLPDSRLRDFGLDYHPIDKQEATTQSSILRKFGRSITAKI